MRNEKAAQLLAEGDFIVIGVLEDLGVRRETFLGVAARARICSAMGGTHERCGRPLTRTSAADPLSACDCRKEVTPKTEKIGHFCGRPAQSEEQKVPGFLGFSTTNSVRAGRELFGLKLSQNVAGQSRECADGRTVQKVLIFVQWPAREVVDGSRAFFCSAFAEGPARKCEVGRPKIWQKLALFQPSCANRDGGLPKWAIRKKECSRPASSAMDGRRFCQDWQQKKGPMADALLGTAQELAGGGR